MTPTPKTRKPGKLLRWIFVLSLVSNVLLLAFVTFLLGLFDSDGEMDADTLGFTASSSSNSPPHNTDSSPNSRQNPSSSNAKLPPPSLRDPHSHPVDPHSHPVDPNLSPRDWAQLSRGLPIVRQTQQDKKLFIVCQFIVQAPPIALFRCLTDNSNLTAVYPDIQTVEVFESSQKHSIIYFRGQHGIFGLEYVLQRDYIPGREIRWIKIDHPRSSQRIRSCRGRWRFDPTPNSNWTLVTYQNHIDIPLLPQSLTTRLLRKSLPEVIRRLRDQAPNYIRQ
ncbi:MAG: SRPBCC family protein [Planctomycetota bacterium]|nr:SRPBCC family protein [Planctomycetota bacterium]